MFYEFVGVGSYKVEPSTTRNLDSVELSRSSIAARAVMIEEFASAPVAEVLEQLGGDAVGKYKMSAPSISSWHAPQHDQW